MPPRPAAADDAAAWTPSGWPLNSMRSFQPWPPLAPGVMLDTNPALVRLEDGTAWVVLTRYATPPQPGAASLWAVRVDDALQPKGDPLLLIPSGMDPRVVRLGDRVLLFYALVERDAERRIAGSCMMLAEFRVQREDWTLQEAFQLPKQPIQRPGGPDTLPNWEKNWVPFVIDDRHVGLIYAHDPWDVLVLQAEPGAPRRLEAAYSSPPLQWDYGTIRGGTPPVRYDADRLITFFHASQITGSSNLYSVGACVFHAQPPFAPVLVTAEPLLVAPYGSNTTRFGWNFRGSVVFPLACDPVAGRDAGTIADCLAELGGDPADSPGGASGHSPAATPVANGFRLLCGRDDGEVAWFTVERAELVERLAPPRALMPGRMCDYRGGLGAAMPSSRLLYVPSMIPGIPELPMVNLLRAVAGRGRSFVDVGAHIGFYTVGLAAGFQRVIAYEPSRFQHHWLRRNVQLNGYDHVEVVQAALGEVPGNATLHVLSHEGGLNSLAVDVAQRYQALDRYDVPVAVLDDRGLTDVDLLKIDVEGYELPVLRGAAQTIAASRPLILIEVWAEPARRRDVRAQMDAFGYTLEFLFPASPELAVCIPRERRHAYKWFL